MTENHDPRSHRFGGTWTDTKLEILQKYLQAYTIALKKTDFKKAYIDAFAGTGYRDPQKTSHLEQQNNFIFDDLAHPEPQELLDGSARISLQNNPPFDSYIFIEKSLERCQQLETLKQDFPEKSNSIKIIQGEANEQIKILCQKNWKQHRAVLFLDPYGMQVDWSTIEFIAQTRSIDLWILFPLGIGVNRLLKTNIKTIEEIPQGWRRRLNSLLGTETWFDEFYKIERTPTLLGYEEEHLVKASIETIGKYFNNRLASIFAGVAPQPAVLKNSSNSPLYLLCFAASNERGKVPALNIANDLLKKVNQV